jgi:replication factor C large subunit
MPFLATMTHHCKNRELTVAMAAQYEMDASHVAFVTGSGEDTNKVQSIVEDAEALREEAAVEGSEGAFEGASAGEVEVDESDDDPTDDGGGQATLGDEGGSDDDEDEDDDIDSRDAEEDDQQSGLSDFM